MSYAKVTLADHKDETQIREGFAEFIKSVRECGRGYIAISNDNPHRKVLHALLNDHHDELPWLRCSVTCSDWSEWEVKPFRG